ncbi:MAG: hypothetical protein C0600_13705 [Ignavibacteria bacterium]|nr:MAG: hypothetical protein C0600_13705 [Ignavibacteria bacterium]
MTNIFRFLPLIAILLLPNMLRAQVSEDITSDELREHVEFLASDELQGRKPGTEGGDAAAEYIRDRLREAGLELLDNDGMQSFPIVTGISAADDCALTVDGVVAELGKNFTPVSFTGEAAVEAGVVFAGYGFDFELDSSAWHDYEGLDVTGKWVLVLRGSPDSESGDFDPFMSLRKKAMVAHDHGAAGVLFTSGPGFDKDDALVEMGYQQQERAMDLPVLSISRTLADDLLGETTIESLEKELNTQRAPLRTACSGSVSSSIRMERHSIEGHNVIGLIKGEGPHADEYIVLGAHYDHLGMGGPGSGSRRPDTSAVHNGADDNASGVAAIIEVAERISASGKVPGRSILVVAFTAEEMGLLGAKYFVDNPPVDLQSLKLMCNLDMVGRMPEGEKSLSISGTGTAEGLSALVEDVVAKEGFTAKLSPEGYGPSDHAAFYSRDVPVLFFFTGINQYYHTPEDDADKLNYVGEKLLADLVHGIVEAVAQRPDALTYVESGPKSRPATSKRFKVTLGIMPDVSSSNEKGLRADAVMEGRPAFRAGMKKGDIIVSMEGKSVNGVYEYMDRLSEFKSGQRITVEVLRDGEKVLLIVEL